MVLALCTLSVVFAEALPCALSAITLLSQPDSGCGRLVARVACRDIRYEQVLTSAAIWVADGKEYVVKLVGVRGFSRMHVPTRTNALCRLAPCIVVLSNASSLVGLGRVRRGRAGQSKVPASFFRCEATPAELSLCARVRSRVDTASVLFSIIVYLSTHLHTAAAATPPSLASHHPHNSRAAASTAALYTHCPSRAFPIELIAHTFEVHRSSYV